MTEPGSMTEPTPVRGPALVLRARLPPVWPSSDLITRLLHLEIEEQVASGRRDVADELESPRRQAVEQFSAGGGNCGRDDQPQLVDQALLEQRVRQG